MSTATSLAAMDNLATIGQLAEIGGRAAEVQINDEHFPKHFDPVV